MVRIFFLIVSFNISTYAIHPSFCRDNDTNLRIAALLVQKVFCSHDININVGASFGADYCSIEANLEGLDLIRKNHLRHFRTIRSDFKDCDIETIATCLDRGIISMHLVNEKCVIKLKDYETRKLLSFTIKVNNLKTSVRAYPAFGKTDEESLSIAVAVVDSILQNVKEGQVEIIQKKDNEMEVNPFTGKLRFRIAFDGSIHKKDMLSKENISTLLQYNKIKITKIRNEDSCVLYLLSFRETNYSDLFFTLIFENSSNHQILQMIFPQPELVTASSSPFFHAEMSSLFFRRVSISNSKPSKSVAVLVPYGYLGERNWSNAISEALDLLKVSNVIILQENCVVPKSILINEYKLMFDYIVSQLEDVLKIDISMSISHVLCKLLKKTRLSLLAITVSDLELSQEISKHPQILDQIASFDGYLHSKLSHENLMNLFQYKKSEKKFIFTLYPACLPQKLATSNFKKLLYCGQNWDKKRSSDKFKKLFQLLEIENKIDVYGPSSAWPYLSTSYKGLIPFEKNAMSHALVDYGIILCLHSDTHLGEGIPTARFFEVVAVGALPICDEHPFFIQHFRDAALFIDTSGTAESICNQIKDHTNWVISNPNQAKEMAQRAKKIFTEKFSLDKTLSVILDQTSFY